MAEKTIKIRAKLKGDEVTVKALLKHPMETGLRKDKKSGEMIPRKIINAFKVDFNGQTVFEAALEPAISANPYIQFTTKVMESGEFHFTWTDDDGSVYETKKSITVQ